MKFRFVVAALAISATVSNAQIAPPAAPGKPATVAPPSKPIDAPAPAKAPSIGYPSKPMYYIDSYESTVRAQERALEAQDRAREIQERTQERVFESQARAQERALEAQSRASTMAMERTFEAQARASEMARERAAEALERAQSRIDWSTTDHILSVPATAYAYNYNYNKAYAAPTPMAAPRFEPGITRMPLPQWSQDDPADSLYRVAYDAMNRGDWRRAADQFAQVCVKYANSNRCLSANYFEAFMHYRIGTTEELKTAQRLLVSERSKRVSDNSRQAEIASLTTRVRGALAARGDQEAARALQADAQSKGTSCDNEDIQVRTEALSALAQSDITAATPMLRRVLDRKDLCSLELRRSALRILLRRADTSATSAAISVAKNTDEALDLRTDAISYLSRLPGDNALATLEELMRSSTDKDIQRAAVRSISRSDNGRARSAIRALIDRNDVSEQLRAEAISTFDPERSSNEDAAWLRNQYAKMPSERLKISVISALGRIGGSENDAFVLGIARNTNESSDVRSAAIGRMSRNANITVGDLKKLYDAAESRQMREQLINSLRERKEADATDALLDIAKNGTDPYLRRQAINALGRRDDPRAKTFLSEIVNK